MSGMRDSALPPRKRAAMGWERESNQDPPPPPPLPPPPQPPPLPRRKAPVTRCTHCGTTNTPLWRKGPAGPGTLCNACGTRWKRHGSTRLRRPISTSTPEAIAAEEKAKMRERRERSPSPPTLPPEEPVPVYGPAAAARGRVRPRRIHCAVCDGFVTHRGAKCANCQALDDEKLVVEEGARTDAVEFTHVGSSSSAAVRRPAPSAPPPTNLGAHPDLSPTLVAAYNRPPGPVPWEAPTDDFFEGVHLTRDEGEKRAASSTSSYLRTSTKKRALSPVLPPAHLSPSKLPKVNGADVERVCVSCGVTDTPLWRRGPTGSKSLCNACGTRWKRYGKLEPLSSNDRRTYHPIARRRKPPIQRKLPESPEPPKSPMQHFMPEADSTLTPEEAARDIPYLPALHEAIPGGIEGMTKEARLSRSKRSRRRTLRGQEFFGSLAELKAKHDAVLAPTLIDTSSRMEVDSNGVNQVDKLPKIVSNNLPEERPSEGCTMN